MWSNANRSYWTSCYLIVVKHVSGHRGIKTPISRTPSNSPNTTTSSSLANNIRFVTNLPFCAAGCLTFTKQISKHSHSTADTPTYLPTRKLIPSLERPLPPPPSLGPTKMKTKNRKLRSSVTFFNVILAIGMNNALPSPWLMAHTEIPPPLSPFSFHHAHGSKFACNHSNKIKKTERAIVLPFMSSFFVGSFGGFGCSRLHAPVNVWRGVSLKRPRRNCKNLSKPSHPNANHKLAV